MSLPLPRLLLRSRRPHSPERQRIDGESSRGGRFHRKHRSVQRLRLGKLSARLRCGLFPENGPECGDRHAVRTPPVHFPNQAATENFRPGRTRRKVPDQRLAGQLGRLDLEIAAENAEMCFAKDSSRSRRESVSGRILKPSR